MVFILLLNEKANARQNIMFDNGVSTLHLLLASSSLRRKMLLESLGFQLEIVAPEINEDCLLLEKPDELVLRLSCEKAKAVQSDPADLILAADTVVVCQNQILGKPADQNQARQFLKMLSGKCHEVFTGFTLLKDQQQLSQVVRTKLWFRYLQSHEIEAYVLTDEPYDKSGGYAVQGKAAAFVDRIEGSFTNIIGLPLKEVLDALELISHAT